MKEQTLKKIYVLIQVSFSLIFLSLIILSKGTTDAGDGITHYLISKGALNHPELFFDHWGKPLFTMFSSGFSYFGYKGICVFNGLCIIATSIIAELVVIKHTNKNGFPFAFILTLFCPVLFACGFAGLTEPLFALILCLGIFLLYTERYISGSLLLSFIPFVRTEGFLLIPIFFLFTILQKKWKSGLWLTAGTIMMSLGGSWVYNTIFWILEKNPYKGAKALYGSGPLMHFVVNSETIFGWAFTIIVFSGISIILFRTLKNKAPENQKLILLCILTFFTYYIAHSIFWWKGLVGSLGLFRVMAAIVPAGSIIGAVGIHQILAEKDKKIYLSGPIILLLVWHIYHPFKLYKPPIKPDGEQALFLRISRD